MYLEWGYGQSRYPGTRMPRVLDVVEYSGEAERQMTHNDTAMVSDKRTVTLTT